ncbi:copper-binding protein [Kaarinaea lacus]
MKKHIINILLCCGVFFANQVWAGDEHEVEGVIKDIKAADNKLTISHGPIKSLGMDGMTMDFVVSDPGMLEIAQKGHTVSFVIEVDKKGNFIITDIEDKGMAQ